MRALVACALLTGGALWGIAATPHRLADASSFVLMADSLLHDRDLRYDAGDLARARALRFGDVPAGLLLVRRDDGAWAYAKPFVYPVAAAPWYAAFGVRGFLVLNGVLLALLVLLGAAVLRPRFGHGAALLVSAAVLGGSVVPSYLHWIDPFLLLSVVVAVGVAAHRRGWAVLAGVAFGVATTYRYPYAALAVVPFVLLLRARRRGAAAGFAAGFAGAALAVAAATWASIGHWSPYLGDRWYFAGGVPFDGSDGAGAPFSRTGLLGAWTPPVPGAVARGLLDFVVGRYAGILLYFPTFFVCLLWTRRWTVERVLWLGAVAGFALVLELTVPHNRIGGAHALGNRFFVLLPLALCFVDPGPWRAWRVVASAALLLLAVPLVHDRAGASLAPGRMLVAWPHRWFPFEWALAEHVSYPVRFPGMSALTTHQHGWERETGGVWTEGARRATFVLVRPRDRPPTVRLSSRLPVARVVDGTTVRRIRFGDGPREITLAHPMVVYRNEYGDGGEVAVYRLGIETDRAFVPAAEGLGADPRVLGVFVQPLS